MALSRNGIVFPLELPTVTVARGSQETPVIDVRAAGADVNVVEHLMDNQLHYSQAIYRNLDAAMLAGLLAPYSVTINEQSVPLVQVAEPTPVRIVGNALVFKINTDPINDEEWRDFMASRGVGIGDSKVDIVPLSSGGIFAEAVLGRFNCAERLDLSRFFNWQDSPIPIQPTDIAAIQTGLAGDRRGRAPWPARRADRQHHAAGRDPRPERTGRHPGDTPERRPLPRHERAGTDDPVGHRDRQAFRVPVRPPSERRRPTASRPPSTPTSRGKRSMHRQ